MRTTRAAPRTPRPGATLLAAGRAGRRGRRGPTVAAVVLGTLLAPATLRAQDSFHWRGELGPGQVLEVKGVNGAIRAEPAEGREVEVTATKRAGRSDPDEVRVEVVRHAEGITICALYATGGRGSVCAPGGGGRTNVRNNDVQVDFTVKAPTGVRFIGRTVNGSLSALRLEGDVELYTVNGGIELRRTL